MDLERELFYKNLESYNDYDYLYIYLKYHLAPVVEGIKPSSILNMAKGLEEKWQKYGLEIIQKLQLECAFLRKGEGKCILWFYRRDLLTYLIEQDKVKNYLQKEDYHLESVDTLITSLIRRYDHVHCPHEVGIFLGIPLEDVKAFREEIKKPCLLKGYWKVYSHLESAKALFKAYDLAKYKVIHESLK